MATYIINQCLTNITYNISGTTFSEGEIIGFYIGEDLFCGVVGQETNDPITTLSLYDSTFTDCCECLSAITDSFNLRFIGCDDGTIYDIDATNFCNSHGTPLTGRTYEIQFGSDTPFCATFEDITSTGETNYFYASGPYSECNNCGQEPPRSANTETILCVVCSGETSTVIPPHAIYTDAQGVAVTQLNTVALGGPNGLNN